MNYILSKIKYIFLAGFVISLTKLTFAQEGIIGSKSKGCGGPDLPCSLTDIVPVFDSALTYVVAIVSIVLIGVIAGFLGYALIQPRTDGMVSQLVVAKNTIQKIVIGLLLIGLVWYGGYSIITQMGFNENVTRILRQIQGSVNPINVFPRAYAQAQPGQTLQQTQTGQPNTGAQTGATQGAQNTQTQATKLQSPVGATSFASFIEALVKVFINVFVYPALAFGWAYVGFSFIKAQGNPGELVEARKRLKWALIITIALFMISTLISTLIQTLISLGK